MLAARDVIHPAIDFPMAHFSLSPQHAYIPCSVALDLRISQCVDTLMITVTGVLDRSLFEDQGWPGPTPGEPAPTGSATRGRVPIPAASFLPRSGKLPAPAQAASWSKRAQNPADLPSERVSSR